MTTTKKSSLYDNRCSYRPETYLERYPEYSLHDATNGTFLCALEVAKIGFEIEPPTAPAPAPQRGLFLTTKEFFRALKVLGGG